MYNIYIKYICICRSAKRRKVAEKLAAKEARKNKRIDGFDVAMEEESEDEATGGEMDTPSSKKGKAVVKKVEETNEQRLKREEKEKMIRAGMGFPLSNSIDEIDMLEEQVNAELSGEFEVVPREREEIFDPEVGSEEHIQFLALATKMKLGGVAVTKDLVDASYNRYCYNDDGNLPSWFMDDEKLNNRPQIPITKEMVNKIRARYREMSAAPIGKVAEAQARRKMKQFKEWKKKKAKISSVTESTEMTESAKKKAIEKMYRGNKVKKPSKVYMVAKAGGDGKKSGRKVKFVDSKLKKDNKAVKRRSDGKHKVRTTKKQSKSKSRR
jgi:AdoMet-dependent rRNA methyltransferase SPB1